MSEKAFTAGEAEQVGDCGKWAAYIDDQSHKSPLRSAWYARIRVLGNTERQADELRSIILDALNAKPEVVAWDGEGLPPVGTVCEFSLNRGRVSWEVGTVLAHDGVFAVMKFGSEYHPRNITAVRPIRTPEQVARDKSTAAWIEQIEKEYGWDTAAECERILIEGGYRKQVAP